MPHPALKLYPPYIYKVRQTNINEESSKYEYTTQVQSILIVQVELLLLLPIYLMKDYVYIQVEDLNPANKMLNFRFESIDFSCNF